MWLHLLPCHCSIQMSHKWSAWDERLSASSSLYLYSPSPKKSSSSSGYVLFTWQLLVRTSLSLLLKFIPLPDTVKIDPHLQDHYSQSPTWTRTAPPASLCTEKHLQQFWYSQPAILKGRTTLEMTIVTLLIIKRRKKWSWRPILIQNTGPNSALTQREI